MEVLSLYKIKIVFTVALKQELPIDSLKKLPTVSIITLKSIRAGNFSSIKPTSSILFVITGVGSFFSTEAITWINLHLSPLYIINWGTCGSHISEDKIGDVLFFPKIQNEGRLEIETDSILPFLNMIRVAKYPLTSVHNVSSLYEYTDMEAYFQAQKTNHFFSIKVVSDIKNNFSNFQLVLSNIHTSFCNTFSWLFNTVTANDVSVIIPTYNRNFLCRRAIQSCLNQTILPYEIIVVDDGSTDSTLELQETFKSSAIVHFIRIEENKGVSYARNMGIKASSSPWISLLDSDDYWNPTKLENQITYLSNHPYYMVLQSQDEWIKNYKKITIPKHLAKEEGWIFEESLKRCVLSPSCVLLHRHLFEWFNYFDESLRYCEDYDLWLQITRYIPVGLDPHINLIRYAGHSDQLSQEGKLDIYRVEGLQKAYQTESVEDVKDMIFETLKKKLTILIEGAKKRGIKPDKRVLKIAALCKIPTSQ